MLGLEHQQFLGLEHQQFRCLEEQQEQQEQQALCSEQLEW